MKLTLDGRQVKTSAAGGETLLDVIKTLERDISPERVIVSITLDGQPLDSRTEHEKAALPVEQLDSLEVNTQKLSLLARNTLSTLAAYLPQLIDMMDQAVELLHGGQESEGHLCLSRLIDGLSMANSAWHGIAHFIVIEDRAAGDVMPDMQSFLSSLQSILEAQKNNDVVQICDLLEFELRPILELWLEHAGRLNEKLK